MKMFNRVIDGCLPVPAVLARALRDGTVRIAKSGGGQVAYFVAPHCANKDAVKRAIARRGMWELISVVVFSSVTVALLVGIVQNIIE